MDRTLRAALLAGLIGFVAVAGLGAFLVPGAAVAAVVAGLVAGVLAAVLILAAARRADSFEAPPTAVKPSHPGPPDPAPEHAADAPDDAPDDEPNDEDDRV